MEPFTGMDSSLPAISPEIEEPEHWPTRVADLPRTAAVVSICDHVASGGSIIDWCRARGYRYGTLSRWISSDEWSREQVNAAKEARNEWSLEVIIQELHSIATFSLADCYREDGSLKTLREMPFEVARCIQAVESDEIWGGGGKERMQIGENKRIKGYDKLKALELIGKKLRIWTERVEHEGNLTLEQLIEHEAKGNEKG